MEVKPRLSPAEDLQDQMGHRWAPAPAGSPALCTLLFLLIEDSVNQGLVQVPPHVLAGRPAEAQLPMDLP